MASLTVGWEVTQTREPRYWLQPGAKPGAQSASDLVTIPAELMGTHTAVIAQSGAGKSFFIGRLVEEILVNTRARCLVIDPNGDFRRASEVEDETLWTEAAYDPTTRSGKLPHEESRDVFEARWRDVAIRIRAAGEASRVANRDPSQALHFSPLQFSWTSLDVTFFAEDVDPLLQSDLFHCHQFVRTLDRLLKWREAGAAETQEATADLLATAERLIADARSRKSRDEFRKELMSVFPEEALVAGFAIAAGESSDEASTHDTVSSQDSFAEVARSIVDVLLNELASTASYISDPVQRYYFGRVREYQRTGILDTTSHGTTKQDARPHRLDIIDLPSVSGRSTRLMAADAVLAAEWSAARNAWTNAMEHPSDQDTRVPSFIVVDEAHNLIPAEVSNRAEAALRDQFRTIVAEGRKYGLFLIIASQRPDKLDPMVLSECENAALMKINNESVLDLSLRLLGLDDVAPRVSKKCLEFDLGCVLLGGQWMPDGPQITYSAARRTAEGGRNLRAEYWASSLPVSSATETNPDNAGSSES